MATVLGVMALAGCAVGPNYQRPDAPAVERFTAQPLPQATVSADTAGGDAQQFLHSKPVPQRWWTTFGSAEIDRRVQAAFAHSPTMASARAALRQAQESALAAGGSRYPAIDAGVGATRQKQSSSALGGISASPLTVYNASVSVGYTLDLFGGVRRDIEAQQARADYQSAQLDATYLTLASNVVTASLREASLAEQVQASEQIIDSLKQQLGIAQQQQAIGTKSLSDALAVSAELASTQATLPALNKALAATRNQLATYLGTTPAQLAMQPLTLAEVTLPTHIPLSLPSTVVAQRPDIRAASALLHAPPRKWVWRRRRCCRRSIYPPVVAAAPCMQVICLPQARARGRWV
ncbi:MAG: efflux transporter outer membrane subunit [Xanthomonadales bacterium]|nr:efflux transporter outer membrane subunit [Xanthomonadales bacterium]